jgi:hypothetical protein
MEYYYVVEENRDLGLRGLAEECANAVSNFQTILSDFHEKLRIWRHQYRHLDTGSTVVSDNILSGTILSFSAKYFYAGHCWDEAQKSFLPIPEKS